MKPPGRVLGALCALTAPARRAAQAGFCGWKSETVAAAGDAGCYNSLAVVPSAQPALACCHLVEPQVSSLLKYAWFDGMNRQTGIVDDPPKHAGHDADLAILASGQPAMAWSNCQNHPNCARRRACP